MNQIKLISHETFPEDQYTKEIAYISVNGSFPILYTRKMTKDGNLFWDVSSIGITFQGKKKYFKAVDLDSNSLIREVKDFLDAKAWLHKQSIQSPTSPPQQNYSQPELFPQAPTQPSNEGIYWENPPF